MPVSYDKRRKYSLLEEVGFRKYFKAERWEDFNRQFFDGLAPKYDVLNEVLSLGRHRHFKKRALERTAIAAGERILDVCTGSGDMSLFVAAKHPDCRITGVDVSGKMLEIARRRAAGIPNVRFQTGNTLRLPFSDNSFDVTLISFGLRNLEDLERGLRELKRVTRPGGRVMNLDLGIPPNPLLRAVHALYFRRWIPWLGKTFFHRGEFNSFHYLPASGRYFPPQWELVEMFRAVGFEKVRRYDYMLGAVSQQVAFVPFS